MGQISYIFFGCFMKKINTIRGVTMKSNEKLKALLDKDYMPIKT